MIRIAVIAASLVLSTSAFAAESDVSIFSDKDIVQLGIKKIGNCLKEGWKAASPTEDQTAKAKAFIQTAEATLEGKKDALRRDKQALMDAWSASPVSREAVEAAETALYNDMMPVRKAFQEAKINALNLLSPEQKTAFNSAVKSCHKPAVEQERGEEQEEE